VGQAAGLVFSAGDHRHASSSARTTRAVGYMIEYAMVAGFTSVGMDVLPARPMPDAALAMLTKSCAPIFSASCTPLHNCSRTTASSCSARKASNYRRRREADRSNCLTRPIDRRLSQSASLGRARRIDGVQ